MSSIPRIVIVGAGFGGLEAARALRRQPVQVELIDRRNYHLFQPLLYQVATSGLSPGDIAYPVRAIVRGQSNVTFRMAEVREIDLAAKRLTLDDGADRQAADAPSTIDYDALILAPGGTTHFFNNDSMAQDSLPLKDVDDAIAIRDRLLTMFERAAHEPDRLERQRLLTFVCVGGGPTGVECAGAISELVRLVLVKDFPALDIEDVRILVVEGGPAILSAFSPALRDSALRLLRKKHVEVRLNARVDRYDGRFVQLTSGEKIPTCTVIWAAGVRAAPLTEKLGVPLKGAGRVVVNQALSIPEHPELFVIGDAAYLEHQGAALPQVAQVAMQQGRVAAHNAAALLTGGMQQLFRYRDPGILATIGRNAAVARLGRFEFAGFFAWLIWVVIHIAQLIGFRNRLVVLINWAWDYFLYDRAVRLISPGGDSSTQ